ncbi:MAG: glycosyltransferase, partial [Anaerolineae bacterium]
MTTNQPISITVIIPVYNGGDDFRRCLEALAQTHYPHWDCLVVDDGSTDDSAALAAEFGAHAIPSRAPQSGPAQARNLGAQAAAGDILFFIDADVLVKPDTIGLVAQIMADPGLAACFGSYDDTPTEPSFLSQYRNLQHHYVHQTGSEEAFTFWSGCGAMRRHIFLAMGGFNVAAYPRPSIEDIELGYRLRAAGHRIRLEKSLQVGHMKRWTPRKVLLTDIRDRALPWTQLILQDREIPNDLNLQAAQRLSVAAAFVLVGSLLAALFWPGMLGVTAVTALLLLWLNRDFYGYLRQKRESWFLARALFWHWLYFLYSGATFALCLLFYKILQRPNPAPQSNVIRPLP